MLIQSDAFNLPYKSKTFHACVTSPPYWGLRKYAGEQGDEPLGLEATPERHIERMVEVFREVRRVLRDDGVCWLNYGDCFSAASTSRGKGKQNEEYRRAGRLLDEKGAGEIVRNDRMPAGQLMLMPHRLAIALQADGWIVRNDLVWFKRNPMPESVAGWRWERSRKNVKPRGRAEEGDTQDWAAHTGQSMRAGGQPLAPAEWEYGDDYVLRKSSWRHTRAHEYVFQLVKGMGYYCNQEVVREGASDESGWAKQRAKGDNTHQHIYGTRWTPEHSSPHVVKNHPSGRNPRSVLDVPTAPYKGAHYATFPPKLIAPLIRASVPRRCCPECGQAWAPVVERGYKKSIAGPKTQEKRDQGLATAFSGYEDGSTHPDITVTDYRPTCECGVTEHKPGIVLDIFGGSGTTGMVAKELLRRWVVMDISRPYLDEQAKVRTGSGTPSKALEGLPMFGGEDE